MRGVGRTLVRYGFAIASVLVAFALRKLLEPVTGIGAPFVLFFGAVMMTSLLAGPGPGAAAAAVGAAVGALGFVVPVGYRGSQAAAQAALFAIDAAVVVYLSHTVNVARRTAVVSAARARNLIELAPEAFFLSDLDGRYVDVNQAACGLLRYAREELIGKRIVDIMRPEDQSKLAAVRATLLSGGVERGEWTLVRKDGTHVPVELRANIISDGSWQAFVRDITDRRRVEQRQRFLAEAGAVLASSLDYEQTLTTLGELVVREQADFCIIDLVEESERALRLKVVTADPALAEAAAALERVRLDPRSPSLARAVLETGRPYLVEQMTPAALPTYAQSAEHLEALRALDPQSVMGLPLSIRGQLLGVLVVASSSPWRRYGADDLEFARALADRAALAIENGRLYQRAVRATRLRDEVLAVVAHDLRNPLALIRMQAGLLARRGPEPERRNQRPREVIVRSADRMNRLIQDLLDVSLIEAGQLGLQAAKTPARQVLVEAVEGQHPMASSRGLHIAFDCPAELPEVWADPHRLAQVLANLVGNAIKFTPAGGRITVGATPSEDEVLFWVGDTGAGIPPAELPRVFDRFWRTNDPERRGAGLGLPITRGIVEAHGGRIWVESAAGRGSVFFFTIPRAAGDAQAPGAEPAPVPG